jgi:hypothetical protein
MPRRQPKNSLESPDQPIFSLARPLPNSIPEKKHLPIYHVINSKKADATQGQRLSKIANSMIYINQVSFA